MKLTKKQEELVAAYRSGRYGVFALGGGTGCLSGRMCVYNPEIDRYIKISKYKSGDYVRAWDASTDRYRDVRCEVPGEVGVADIYLVRAGGSGYRIACTMAHKFYTPTGYVRLADLRIGDEVFTYNGQTFEHRFEAITSVVLEGRERYYDLHVPGYNNYLAQGFLNHNSAKTIGILNLLHVLCLTLPNLRFAVFRKSEKNLKNNTIPSYKKVLYWQNQNIPIKDMKARYPNGSEILFLWADATKDADYDNIKGGEYTGCFFNEANQIEQGYFELAKTRVGRWNDIKLGDKVMRIKPSIFLDFNPTDNWVKTNFYDKDRSKTLSSDVFFQLSLPKDNPFLSEDVMKMLETLPEAEYRRYVLGEWDYGDDPQQLIQYIWLRNNFIVDMPKTGKILLGVDVARYGDDSTVFAYMRNNVLFKFEEFKKISTTETARLILTRMKEYKINAEDIVIDVVGLGAGVVDSLKDAGVNCHSFHSGEKATTQLDFYMFFNKRAEAHWYFREALRLDKIEVIEEQIFIAEATTNRYEITDKMIRIEDKDSVKKRLKRSPNYLDAAVMVHYILYMQSVYKVIDISKLKPHRRVFDIYDDSLNVKEALAW